MITRTDAVAHTMQSAESSTTTEKRRDRPRSKRPRRDAPLPPERPEDEGQMGEEYLRLFYEPELVDGEETYDAVYHFVSYILKGKPLGQCFAAYNAAFSAAADHVERRLSGGGQSR